MALTCTAAKQVMPWGGWKISESKSFHHSPSLCPRSSTGRKEASGCHCDHRPSGALWSPTFCCPSVAAGGSQAYSLCLCLAVHWAKSLPLAAHPQAEVYFAFCPAQLKLQRLGGSCCSSVWGAQRPPNSLAVSGQHGAGGRFQVPT